MIAVRTGARAAGACANTTINHVADIARAMGSLGNAAADGDAAAGDAADAAARAAAPTPSQVLHIGGKSTKCSAYPPGSNGSTETCATFGATTKKGATITTRTLRRK